MSAPVVAGVDGSDRSLAAVDAAAREARMRGRPLLVVHAVPAPPPAMPTSAGLPGAADPVVTEALRRARASEPGIDAEGESVPGTPATVLLERARAAELVVVGDRGLDGFAGLLLGSTGYRLAAHAACPVLLVRGRPDPSGGVLLGVDGSPAGDAAVGFAFAEAALRRTELVAVHAWNDWTGPASTGPGDMKPLVYDVAMLEAEEQRVLAEALSGWRASYPDVPVRQLLVHGRTRTALIEATGGAQLVVVGARGRGGFAGLLIGSVSQAVLHHADCPVAVIRHARKR